MSFFITLIFLGAGIFFSALHAVIPSFSPGTSFLFSKSEVFPFPGEEVGWMFQNPAHFVSAKQQQFQVNSSSPVFGYSRIQTGYVTPFYKMALGIGYNRVSSHDIPRVSQESGSRPVISGSFSHSMHSFMLAVGMPLIPSIHVGIKIGRELENLSVDERDHYLLDAGVTWALLPDLHIGTYTKGFFQYTEGWKLSREKEFFARSVITEAFFYVKPAHVYFSTDWLHIQTAALLELHPSLQLSVNSIWRDSLEPLQLNGGVRMQLSNWTILYSRLFFYRTALHTQQDKFGLMFRW